MNVMDTIFFKGDLLVGKVSGYNDVLPIVIKQTTESSNNDIVELTWIICGTLATITLLIILGCLLRPIMEKCFRKKTKEYERKKQELEHCHKLKESYSSKLLEELKAQSANNDYINKLNECIEKLDTIINELNEELK